MIVISDTTPIISLLKINRLSLLQDLFGEVKIPLAVFNELTVNLKFAEEIEAVKNSLFIKISEVKDKSAVEIFQKTTGLDLGESEAIVLSKELDAKLILMDELRGRTVAQQMDLELMGTVGILMAAYKRKLISSNEVKKCAQVLKNSKRFLSDALLEFLVNETSK